MTQEKIKEETDAQYAAIKKAEERLVELRKICKHPSKFEGNYSVRVGNIQRAIICCDCGSLIIIL